MFYCYVIQLLVAGFATAYNFIQCAASTPANAVSFLLYLDQDGLIKDECFLLLSSVLEGSTPTRLHQHLCICRWAFAAPQRTSSAWYHEVYFRDILRSLFVCKKAKLESIAAITSSKYIQFLYGYVHDVIAAKSHRQV